MFHSAVHILASTTLFCPAFSYKVVQHTYTHAIVQYLLPRMFLTPFLYNSISQTISSYGDHHTPVTSSSYRLSALSAINVLGQVGTSSIFLCKLLNFGIIAWFHNARHILIFQLLLHSWLKISIMLFSKFEMHLQRQKSIINSRNRSWSSVLYNPRMS